MPKKVTQEEIQTAIRMYQEEHKSLAVIGAELRLAPLTVSKKLKAAGVTVRKHSQTGRKPMDIETRGKIVALYLEDNLTVAQILAAVGHNAGRADLVYSALRATGTPRKRPHATPGKRLPVGSTTTSSDGYVVEKVAKDWPYLGLMSGQGDGTWISQHRKAMADYLGRALLPGEQVHHKNGVRSDNSQDNLQLRSGGHGSGACFKCEDCGSTNVKPALL